MKFTENTPQLVETIPALIQALEEEERSNYAPILKSLKIPGAAYKKYATWSDACYTRNCIVENEYFELILICWEKNQITAIHDHGGEECWVYFVDGCFREQVYATNEEGLLESVQTTDAKAGDVTYMIDFMGFHSLENKSDHRAMSLHLYAKPIKNCNVYNSKENKFVSKELSYDNVLEIQQGIL